ncbi:MAG: ribonuclease P protein component [Acidobacteriota bacterium]
MDETTYGFPKSERLHKRREYAAAYERGQKVQGDHLVLYVLENHLAFNRLGLTVSRRIGNSVTRSRIKRRLREVFRTNRTAISPPSDIIVNAKRSAARVSYQALRDDFLSALQRWKCRVGER